MTRGFWPAAFAIVLLFGAGSAPISFAQEGGSASEGPVAASGPEPIDGDKIAECFGVYDALVAYAEKTPSVAEPDKTRWLAQKPKAETRAIALFLSESLNEDIAREQLAGRAEFVRSEFRDLSGMAGIYGVDDLNKLSLACDPLVG